MNFSNKTLNSVYNLDAFHIGFFAYCMIIDLFFLLYSLIVSYMLLENIDELDTIIYFFGMLLDHIIFLSVLKIMHRLFLISFSWNCYQILIRWKNLLWQNRAFQVGLFSFYIDILLRIGMNGRVLCCQIELVTHIKWR